jgi:hypothetical protein
VTQVIPDSQNRNCGAIARSGIARRLSLRRATTLQKPSYFW